MEKFGVIFDWDGVVIDSSHIHRQSWERLAEEAGRSLPDDHFKKGFGRKNEYIIPNVLEWNVGEEEIVRLGRRKEEHYRSILKETGIAPLAGARDLLEQLKSAGVPCAVGSSTERLNIDTIIRIIGFEPFFQHIVAAEDVTRGKPDPQVFLLAAARIGMAAARCIVFEDSLAGLEAARAGGMKSVGVATTHEPEKLTGHADRIVRRLDELPVAALRDLASG